MRHDIVIASDASRRAPALARTATRAATAATLLAAAVATAPAAVDSTAANASGAAGTPGGCEVRRAFADASLDDWQSREFLGRTDYRLERRDGAKVLSALSEGTASVLYREREVSLRETPRLQWSWQIDGIYQGIDERSKAGDDFPARLYVVVKTGVLPWSTLALNYVWASAQPAGSDWPSPYTGKSHMIAVRSGDDEAGDWVCQSRDLVADFRDAFGVEIDAIDGYAVMVDGDDSDSRGAARFGDIAFLPR